MSRENKCDVCGHGEVGQERDYIIFWERSANSGLMIVHCKSIQEAIDRAKECFDSTYCKVTIARILGDTVHFGERN